MPSEPRSGSICAPWRIVWSTIGSKWCLCAEIITRLFSQIRGCYENAAIEGISARYYEIRRALPPAKASRKKRPVPSIRAVHRFRLTATTSFGCPTAIVPCIDTHNAYQRDGLHLQMPYFLPTKENYSGPRLKMTKRIRQNVNLITPDPPTYRFGPKLTHAGLYSFGVSHGFEILI